MKLKTCKLLTLMIVTSLLAGCHTMLNTGQDEQTRKLQNEQIQALLKPQAELTDLTARTAITIDYNDQNYNVKGRLRMRRDEVVQMSITALGVVEVALLEFTPEAAYLLDRVNKRYAKIDYSSGLLNTVGLNFSTVQALFWNRIFAPGKDASRLKPDNFKLTTVGSQQCIEPTRQSLLKCYFYTDEDCKLLQQTQLMFNDYQVTWHYDMFGNAAAGAYPTIFDISVTANDETAGTHIVLSNVSYTDKTWTAGTNLSRYTQVKAEELLSILKLLK